MFQKPVTYAELSHLFSRGAKLKKTEITEKFKLEDFKEMYGESALPMFVIEEGEGLRVLTEDEPLPEGGDTLVSLVLEPTATETRAKAAT